MPVRKRKADCELPVTEIGSNDLAIPLQTRQVSRRLVLRTHRLEWIRKLPFELLMLIFRNVDFATILNCLMVSRTWHGQILKLSDLWRRMDLKPQNYFWQPRASSLLKHLYNYVEEINIVNYHGEIDKYFAMIEEHEFPRLWKLRIIDRADNKNMAKAIYKALQRIAKTLKELEIVASSCTAISIGKITKTCRSLEYIKLDIRYITDRPTRNDGLTKQLIGVKIHVTVATSLVSKLMPLIRYAPKLQSLTVQEDSLYGLSTFLSQYCPRLAAIGNDVHSTKDTTKWIEVKGSQLKGLQRMSFVNVRSANLLQGYFEKHKGTLQDVRLSPAYNTPNIASNWIQLSHVVMPQLTELHIHDCSNPSVQEQLPNAIMNSKSLQTVLLHNSARGNLAEALPTDDIFYALMKLKHLSYLGLCNFYLYGPAFIQLLDQLVNQPHFTRLSIIECGCPDTSIIQRTTKIPSLETLTLLDSGFQLTAADINEFTTSISSLSRLRCLKVKGMELRIEDFYNIAASTSLRRLFLYGSENWFLEARLLLRSIIVPLIESLKLDDELDTCCFPSIY